VSFSWKRGSNPYLTCSYSILGLGPFANKAVINQQAKELLKKTKTANSGKNQLSIDEYAISDAAKRLQHPRTHAEELLLVHPQTPQDIRKRKRLAKELKKTAVPESMVTFLKLRDPLALFWFTPTPEAEIAPIPGWDELGLAEPGGPDDCEDDIIFDT
jgi:adenylate kinase family enzyme